MNRRDLLIAGSTGVLLGAGGCLQSIENAVTSDPCASGDVEEVSYDIHDLAGDPMEERDRSIALVTGSDHMDKFKRAYPFVRETDFNEAFVVGIRIGSSYHSEGFSITSVGWEDESTIHVFSCMRDPSPSDVADYYTRLLRIPYKSATQEVTTALVTHSTPDSESTRKDTV